MGRREGTGTDRRSFLRLGALGGAAVMAGAGAGVGQQAPTSAVPGSEFELLEVGIAELRRRMESGDLTSVRATELYLERIAALDPRLASVLETNPEAGAIAAALDRERRDGR